MTELGIEIAILVYRGINEVRASASERREFNLQGFEEFCRKVKARFWR